MVKLAINMGRNVMGLCVLGKTCLLDELLSRKCDENSNHWFSGLVVD